MAEGGSAHLAATIAALCPDGRQAQVPIPGGTLFISPGSEGGGLTLAVLLGLSLAAVDLDDAALKHLVRGSCIYTPSAVQGGTEAASYPTSAQKVASGLGSNDAEVFAECFKDAVNQVGRVTGAITAPSPGQQAASLRVSFVAGASDDGAGCAMIDLPVVQSCCPLAARLLAGAATPAAEPSQQRSSAGSAAIPAPSAAPGQAAPVQVRGRKAPQAKGRKGFRLG